MSDNIPRMRQRLAEDAAFWAVNERDLESRLARLMNNGFNPLDIIFSCKVCGATLDEIYPEPDGNGGLESTSDSENGSVVKLYLTQCDHLTCAKHLEGAPFHMADQQPRAACPICSDDQGDTTPKELYPVRGVRNGEFDPQTRGPRYLQPAPVGYFTSTCTPHQELMQFQETALWRYSMSLRKQLEDTERITNHLQSEIQTHEREITRLTTAVEREQGATDEVQAWLEKMNRELDMFKQQKAFFQGKVDEIRQKGIQWDYWQERQFEITCVWPILPPLPREHVAMREHLWGLGLDVPDTQDALHHFGESVRLPGPRALAAAAADDDDDGDEVFFDASEYMER